MAVLASGRGCWCQVRPELPQSTHQEVQLVRGPQLGLALEHQHSPQTPLVTSLLTVSSYKRHTVGQLVPGTAQAYPSRHHGPECA